MGCKLVDMYSKSSSEYCVGIFFFKRYKSKKTLASSFGNGPNKF
jgi:hypothetical protein